ncbi:uncharacterized protein SCHCODRAFT_02706043 [Schizophyllum commune H4-8]|uniref:Uncharacterized protein n=1 Tax=Schizophyllum commune (strain H4-8 / FGSC 9210) TaxID=578458 RepID=D8QJ55_SCHCM|nr:uncharacterized protein SCHCODRAFT_02706043 [Schizophyllum commune H4-8]KAI5886479.1 hypothetical protein SCHCODRAFT_02706043 [Schizophyllum commune H4-8]
MLAVGGAAAVGAILLLVGKPLLVYFRRDGGESSTSGAVDYPAQLAGAGAIGGVLALFLPCIVFLVDAWYLHPMLRLAVPRARWVDVVLYILAQVAFAVGVGVWSAVVPLGGKGSSEMEENSAVTTARAVVDGVEAAVLGSTVLHAGRALLFSGLWAVRYVPRGVEEVGVRSDD